MRMKRIFAVATTLLLALCLAQAQTDPPRRGNRGRGAEQQPQTTPPTATGQGGQAGQQRPAPPPEEKSSVTRSSVRIGGQQINADFIYQYLTRNERWASPKFLIGESYGTTRSAQLSYTL
jgi:hypothetical protein